MTREDLEILSGFEAVWERVMTGKAPEPVPPWTAREELLQGLYAQWQDCRALARCASGSAKCRLQTMAEAAKTLFRRLQTEYFLETGDIFLTRENANFASYTPYNLRKAWKNAMKLAGTLQNAAETEESLLAEAAAVMEVQAETLKQLISEALQ